jgi:hypothetical protein
MIYTIEKAKMVSDQLRKFTSGYAHHVYGQYANIDFWFHEVIEAIKTIDEYPERFLKICDAQKYWVKLHNTKAYKYCPHCGGKCEFDDGTPSDPAPTSDRVLQETKRDLVNNTYYFLARCYRMGLLDDKRLKERCDLLGTGIDPGDLKRKI